MSNARFYCKNKGEYLEVIVRDFAGGKVEKRKIKLGDRESETDCLRWLHDKWGFSPSPDALKGTSKEWLDINSEFFEY